MHKSWVPLAAASGGDAVAQERRGDTPRPMRVVCIGGHPDDPESGCGGTLRLYAEQGHAVTVAYLTRGEAGIKGADARSAAATRTAECEAACRILGVKHTFLGQIDGATEITPARITDFTDRLVQLQPDVVLTQWPLDTHNDHAIAGQLTLRACLTKLRETPLYFFEVYTGHQTLLFHPTDYVDVTATRDVKKKATYAHRSQDPDRWYPHHEHMERFRGYEAGVEAAEAFVRLATTTRSRPGRVLPVAGALRANP